MSNYEKSFSTSNIETGQQGPITETVLKLAEKVPGEDTKSIANIASYIHSLKNINTEEPNFTRTADQIIKSGEQWGCHEAGLVFVTLLRAKGVQVSYVETFLREDLINYDKEKPENIRGHVFLRQLTDNGYRIINATTGEITKEIPEKYVLGSEGLDSWDIGLRIGLNDFSDLAAKAKIENNL